MNITLITVGKIKEKYFTDAIAEYSKRLSRYCKLNVIQVNDEPTPDNASEAQELAIKEKEGQRILDKVKDGSYVCVMAIEGKQMDSVEMSKWLDKLGVSGRSDVTFIIGGSLGLSEAVMKRADYKMSFSKLTFPHQLMRVVLLEQIYRCFRISHHEPYHK